MQFVFDPASPIDAAAARRRIIAHSLAADDPASAGFPGLTAGSNEITPV
jgi:hypothetical protein